jgi:hypothetical protein
MVGLILALVVAAIVLTLFGRWIVGIPIALVAIVLFVFFLFGFGRRTAEGKP